MENLDEIGKMLGYDQNTMNQVKKMIRENPKMVETLMKNISNNTDRNKKQKRIKPNEKCPCGSDKKYKKCCSDQNK